MRKEECYFLATPYVSPTCVVLVDTPFLRHMPWVHIKELGQARQWKYA